jgi:hypothetical protein
MLVLFFLCLVSTMDAADEKTITKVSEYCKQQTFYTTIPTSFDANIKQRMRELAQNNPDKFKQVVNSMESQEKKSSDKKKS